MKELESTKVSERTSPDCGKPVVTSSCFGHFHKIVELNKNNGWVNPIFQENKSEKYKDEFFCIKVDDFLEIEDNHEVEVFRISKRWGEIIIYCRKVVYN